MGDPADLTRPRIQRLERRIAVTDHGGFPSTTDAPKTPELRESIRMLPEILARYFNG